VLLASGLQGLRRLYDTGSRKLLRNGRKRASIMPDQANFREKGKEDGRTSGLDQIIMPFRYSSQLKYISIGP